MARRKSAARPQPRPIYVHHPPFDGWPYVLTRVTSGVYDIRLLPAHFDLGEQVSFVQAQCRTNRLPICLVHMATQCAVFEEDGGATVIPRPVEGGIIFAERLAPCRELPETPELRARRERLAAFSQLTLGLAAVSESEVTVIVGDQHKGGWKPSPEAKRRLSGAGTIPRGLQRCEACGEWRGECLDPGPLAKGLVVRVSCRCAGQSCCARCGAALHERKLETNRYDETAGEVRFVSGLAALDHRCG